jgi:hypothetical protein
LLRAVLEVPYPVDTPTVVEASAVSCDAETRPSRSRTSAKQSLVSWPAAINIGAGILPFPGRQDSSSMAPR